MEDSCWTSDLVQASVTTLGTADSFPKASHVSRTLHALPPSLPLYVLMDKAYNAYMEGADKGEEPKPFSDRCKQAELENTQFCIINNIAMTLKCA